LPLIPQKHDWSVGKNWKVFSFQHRTNYWYKFWIFFFLYIFVVYLTFFTNLFHVLRSLVIIKKLRIKIIESKNKNVFLIETSSWNAIRKIRIQKVKNYLTKFVRQTIIIWFPVPCRLARYFIIRSKVWDWLIILSSLKTQWIWEQ